MELQPGTKVGDRYEVAELIGSGGTAEVYLVRDLQLNGIELALKLFLPGMLNNSSDLARFQNEVIFARKLGHPNIVRLYDFGTAEDGCHFITMEYVKGQCLWSYLREQTNCRLSAAEAARILFEIALALDHAHSMNVIHRDLKPENVLLTSSMNVKLSDFGSANSITCPRKLTQSGMVIGTFEYLAPEQLQGRRLDARVDVYRLGILALEMVFGVDENSLGFGLSLSEFIAELENSADGCQGAVPHWYIDLVKKCTAERRKDRYGSMSEVAELLDQELHGCVPRQNDGLCPAACPYRVHRCKKKRSELGGLF